LTTAIDDGTNGENIMTQEERGERSWKGEDRIWKLTAETPVSTIAFEMIDLRRTTILTSGRFSF
jgi:hypothetical protein